MHVCYSGQCAAHDMRRKEGRGESVWFVCVVVLCLCDWVSPPHPFTHTLMRACAVCVCVQCVCGVHGDAVCPTASQEKRGEKRRGERRAANQSTKTKEQKREQSERREHKKTEKQKNRKTTAVVRLLRVSQCRRHSTGGAALLLSATFIPTGSRPLSSDRGS